jgi:D-alanine-D-alanine ligase
MQHKRIGVVMGGTSAEREVSLRSGEAVAACLEECGHDVVRLQLGSGVDTYSMLSNARLESAFLCLHGRLGEDGCIQGMLELLGIPYTGSGVLASALAMDKLKAKEMFRLHNVPTPPYYEYSGDDFLTDIAQCHGSFGFPVVVKPRREGSSVGVSVARNFEELARAADAALQHDSSILVERFVEGREIAVGILDERVLGAIEVAPKQGIYDFNAKYTAGQTEYYSPARIAPTRFRGVLNLAVQAARSLGTCGAVRVDMIVTEGMNEYVLEVNTLPGMTETSLLPKIADAAGFRFATLCETIASSARLHTTSPTYNFARSQINQVRTSEIRQLRVAV